MTQILGAIAWRHAFHVGDRLVTQKRKGSYEPFDSRANKSIVFRAKNAIVAIGYSGLAFIDGYPTDTWIISTLLGRPPEEYASITSLADDSFSWKGINESVRRLKIGYEEAYKRLSSAERKAGPQFFNIVGWMYDKRRGRNRPFFCEMRSNPANPARLDASYGKHSWAWDRKFMLQTTPDIPRTHVEWTRKKLATQGNKSPDEFERILIAAIRRIAKERQTVGSTCMCIQIRPFAETQVVVRYANPRTEDKILPPSSGKRTVPIEAYSPYVVAPPTIWAPSHIHGGDAWSQEMYGYKFSWKLVGLNREKRPTQFFRGTQPRPDDPLRGKR